MHLLKKVHILNLNNLIVFNLISNIIESYTFLLLQLLNNVLFLRFDHNQLQN